MLKDIVKFSDGKYANWVNFERAQCVGKQQFASKALARAVARRDRRTGASDYHAYRCKTCGLWHIGHEKLSDR